MRAFPDPYFTLYGQNRIRLFQHMDKIVDREIRIRGNPWFDIFYAVDI